MKSNKQDRRNFLKSAGLMAVAAVVAKDVVKAEEISPMPQVPTTTANLNSSPTGSTWELKPQATPTVVDVSGTWAGSGYWGYKYVWGNEPYSEKKKKALDRYVRILAKREGLKGYAKNYQIHFNNYRVIYDPYTFTPKSVWTYNITHEI